MAELDGLVSFWLLPAAPAAAEFTQCIEGLSASHGAPRFAPHITLFSGRNGAGVREPTYHQRLAQVAQGIKPSAVQVTGVGHSDLLFKTVFLRIAPSDELRTLHERIRASLPCADDYVLEPHLSLIYKELSQPARERIARSIRPPESFVCDALSVVVPGPAGWSDVPSWRARVQVVFQ